MSRFPLTLCTFAALGMAGCTTYYEPPPPVAVSNTTVPAPTAASSAWKPGAGVIQSISLGRPSGSADSASPHGRGLALRILLPWGEGGRGAA